MTTLMTVPHSPPQLPPFWFPAQITLPFGPDHELLPFFLHYHTGLPCIFPGPLSLFGLYTLLMDRKMNASGPHTIAFLGAYTSGITHKSSLSAPPQALVQHCRRACSPRSPLPLCVVLFSPLQFCAKERYGPLQQGGLM